MIQSEYPENWETLAKKCKQRDMFMCVLCGSNKNLEAHHTRNSPQLENLITLCKKCHQNISFATPIRRMVREYNELRLDPNISEEKKEKFHLEIIEKWNESKDIVFRFIQQKKINIKKSQLHYIKPFDKKQQKLFKP